VTERAELGRWGEQLAAEYLIGLGWTVVDRNWRCRAGELDLVARDGELIVVCEVKTRATDRYGAPVAAVGYRKATRLRRAAAAWLAAHPEQAGGAVVRFDVIGIMTGGAAPELDHRRDVLR
jgi:putative endonuclease